MNHFETKIKVSVIVPVYNTEAYLRKCLDSLVNQTLKEIEIVVIDDGSTDESVSIIEEYAAAYPSIFLVLTQKNSGPGAARNLGVEACHGEYIGFLDSDDFMDVTAMETMYTAITDHNADLVYCDFYFDRETKITYKKVRTVGEPRELFIDCFVDPWNKLYRADILKCNNIRFPEGYFYEDTGWFIKTVPYLQTLVKVDSPLVYHLQRPDSSMTELDDRRVTHIFSVLEEMLGFYQTRSLFDSYQKELEYFCSKILLCSSMMRISRVKSPKAISKLLENTFAFLNQYFPHYRNNAYLSKKSIRFYIRAVNRRNAIAFLCLIRILCFFGKDRKNYYCIGK